MGGKTSEHEISLISGREVVKNLPKDKYEVRSLVIPRKGKKWFPKNFPETDVAFIAMHGPYGEDGTIQGMLEMMGVPYTGSGVLASALGMDKLVFRQLMQNASIRMPKSVVVEEAADGKVKSLGRPPYFVKPSNQGSSVGAAIVRNKQELKMALRRARKFGKKVLIEEYVQGLEVTCAILGNNNPRALPLVEIIPDNDFFDYEAKYSGKSQEIAPARISGTLTEKVQQIALRVYKIIGCRGFARVDFILKNKQVPVVLEINTIPGLTPMSLFPKAAKAAGISYAELLDKIIQYALE